MTSGKHAAVLGHPVAHSLSPVLHRAGYAALGLEGWDYTAIDTAADELPERLGMLDPSWAGLSLTMPLKRDALDLMDHIEPLALAVGAMNTVLVTPSKGGVELVGANTDVYGVTEALRPAVADADPHWALILGGGATAASAIAGLAQLGLRRSTIAARSPGKCGPLVRAAHQLGLEIDLIPLRALGSLHTLGSSHSLGSPGHTGPGVIVSTVPAHAADPLADTLRPYLPGGVVLDVSYAPWPSVLCDTSRQLGARVVPGWEMLIQQGLEQFRLMTGHPAPAGAMRQALNEALNT